MQLCVNSTGDSCFRPILVRASTAIMSQGSVITSFSQKFEFVRRHALGDDDAQPRFAS
jgi:hypothetical protein